MESGIPVCDDGELRDRILTGLAAVAELDARFRQSLERFLIGRCGSGDGRSRVKAVEIAGQILAECFVKKPSLLEKWRGGDNLEAFLRTAGENRLKSWWKSPEFSRIKPGSESPELENAPAPQSELRLDPEEAEQAKRALRAGVESAMRTNPEGLVFMRLKGLHGVDQRAISRCRGHHEAQTSRRIKDAMEIIRSTATATAAEHGCDLSWDDLLLGLQRDPSILLGSVADGAADEDFPLLKSLAECGSDEKQWRAAVETMCRDSRSLGFFAQALNRHSDKVALVVKDPALSGMSARLTECIRRSLEILNPPEAAGLVTPLMSDSFTDLLDHVGADGGTLWLLCPGAAALEAVFNPLEPEIAGNRQPLVSGIVSLVLATGEPACVSGVAVHRSHSPNIDIALGKTTRAMIAVPFVMAGTVRGVLTAVRFTRDTAFGNRETAMLGRYSAILADLLIQNLTSRILG